MIDATVRPASDVTNKATADVLKNAVRLVHDPSSVTQKTLLREKATAHSFFLVEQSQRVRQAQIEEAHDDEFIGTIELPHGQSREDLESATL